MEEEPSEHDVDEDNASVEEAREWMDDLDIDTDAPMCSSVTVEVPEGG
jgi:hypothetical protein